MGQHDNQALNEERDMLIERFRYLTLDERKITVAYLRSAIGQIRSGEDPQAMTFPGMTPELASLLTGKSIREGGK
ncbi:MAG: hypothetical protein VR73_14705 [Gammaproteobacteria bacterium BRH_c0]|nr:MAG: hypothetical protein VR73_14705 [Gammaproteobacteria bacterium BRH_c0]